MLVAWFAGSRTYLILFLADDVLVDELSRILLKYGRLLVDTLVHKRLGEHGLVSLIVTVLAVTYL